MRFSRRVSEIAVAVVLGFAAGILMHAQTLEQDLGITTFEQDLEAITVAEGETEWSIDPQPSPAKRWSSIYFEPTGVNPELVPTQPGTFTMQLSTDPAPSYRPWLLFDLGTESISFHLHRPATGDIQHVSCVFGTTFGCTIQDLNPPLIEP